MELITPYITVFILVFLRAGIAVAMLPFLGSKNAPPVFRIGLAIVVSLVLTPIAPVSLEQAWIPAVVLREVVFGIAMGGAARALFYVVEMAGQIASNAMGLSIATVFNPDIGQSTEVARLYGLITLLVFLAADSHHRLVTFLVKSYEVVPLAGANLGSTASLVITAGAGLFLTALSLAAPVVVMMIVVNLLLGFLAKAAPQMNVFFVGYPVYIFVGLFVMLLAMPFFIHAVVAQMDAAQDGVARIITGAGG